MSKNYEFNLLNFWFNPKNEKIWFYSNNEDDKNIANLFYDEIINDSYSIYSDINHYYLYKIILYDQITRHIDRIKNTNFRNLYNDLALKYAKLLLESDQIYNFNPKEIIFIMMPYRHTFELNNLIYIKNFIEKLKINNENIYFDKFYFNTITNIAKLIKPVLYIPKKNVFNTNILCKKSLYNKDKTILKGICENFKKDFEKIDEKSVTVSLSGGPDSMVCAECLYELGFNVTALMINYNNRPESKDEVEMVAHWCYKKGIKLYVRDIIEIKRSNNRYREFYEKITKKIRYDSYLFLGNPVILGHIWDDCFENIITNINKGTSSDNLIGMSFRTYHDNIILIRPLLNKQKKEIINFANQRNLPFLFDSTPKNSNRGYIRDKIKPVFDTFDKNLIQNFMNMSNRYRENYLSFSKILIKNTKFEKNNNIYFVYYEECYCIDYWIDIFKLLNKKYNLNIPKIKSIKNLINKIQNNKIHIKIVLTDKIYCIQNNNNIIKIYS